MLQRVVQLFAVIIVAASASLAAARDPEDIVQLWPGKPPGETAELPAEADTSTPGKGLVAGSPIIRLGNVSIPTLSVFLPPKEKATGASIIVCPGGGYNILAFDLEGTEVADWFNERGVACFVLKYRVPKRPGQEPKSLAALQDGQRAVSLVRSRASEWGLDPARIGILGFSAGGNLAGMTALHFAERRYPKADAADDISSRPDFAVLVYPAYFVEKDGSISPDLKVTKETPPMFLVHAQNDGVTCESSIQMFLALKRAGVPSELHVYPTGGHGYGLRPTEHAVTHWPERCHEWLAATGWLKAK
jgi:acetyl esterase/lipase